MSLASKATINSILKAHGVRPNKLLGQHFLIDADALRSVVETANIQTDDVILEIGPGIGTLTQDLARSAKEVIAIEKDPKMIEILRETSRGINNLRIIEGDALKIADGTIMPSAQQYKLVANIPYYITAPVIRKFLEAEPQPKLMVLMVQKEVAQRICAKPPYMSLLAVAVQFYAKPEIIRYTPKKSFWPQPKVNSAILRIIPQGCKTPKDYTNKFFRVVRAGFSHPRKQLINNISSVLRFDREYAQDALYRAGIDPTRRAQTLSLPEWKKLAELIACFLTILFV